MICESRSRVGRRTSTMEVFADEFVSILGLLALTMKARALPADTPADQEAAYAS